MKKFLALAVSALMLIAMMPSAMAADDATIVMSEPDVFVDNNNKEENTSIAYSAATGVWFTWSGVANASKYTKEENGNIYLKMTDDTSTDYLDSDYGAAFQMADEGISGKNFSFETKVKLPDKNETVTFCFRPDKVEGDNGDSDPFRNNYNYIYAAGRLTGTDDGYVYGDFHPSGTENYTVAQYNGQWISLKWIFDTDADSYKLYCDESFIAEIANATFAPDKNVPKKIKFVQIRLDKSEDEVWLDDTGFDADVNVSKVSDVTKYNFDSDEVNYSPKYTTEGVNCVVAYNGGQALKIGAPQNVNVGNKEQITTAVSKNTKTFDFGFDLNTTTGGFDQNFYARLYGNEGLALSVHFEIYSNGTGVYPRYADKNGGAPLLFGERVELSETMQNYRFTVDRNKETVTVYVGGAWKSEIPFSSFSSTTLNKDIDITYIEFYTYTHDSYDLSKHTDVYIDNLYVKTYDTVSSVDTENAENVVVVKNQIPELAQTVSATFTDGTTADLPVKWTSVDTSNAGERIVKGAITGFADTTINATVNVIELPYEMNVENGTITITAPTNYTPAGKLYIASYEGGVLKNVSIHSAPVTGSTTVEATGDVKVFLLTDALVPLAEEK